MSLSESEVLMLLSATSSVASSAMTLERGMPAARLSRWLQEKGTRSTGSNTFEPRPAHVDDEGRALIADFAKSIDKRRGRYTTAEVESIWNVAVRVGAVTDADRAVRPGSEQGEADTVEALRDGVARVMRWFST